MRLYETTFIINPQTDDAAIDTRVEAVSDIITGNGGKIIYEDRMGTRRMAYEIQGTMQGYYTSFVYEAEPLVLPMLDRLFKLQEAYIRDLTVRFEGDLTKLGERASDTPGFGGRGDRGDRGDRGGRGDRDRGDRGDRPRPPRADASAPAPKPVATETPAPKPEATETKAPAPTEVEEKPADTGTAPEENEL